MKKTFDEKVALDESIKYFDGDSLAASTWINKYALRNEAGELLEYTPVDMFNRIIPELVRIESKKEYPELTEKLLHQMMDGFKYFILGGSSMSGIGNNFKYTSISNCFVIDSPVDSYGGIFKSDQELVQLMKRRGGVGLDLSNLRPASTRVTNDAKTSSGLASFMDRFSNSTNEVSQLGRRGALMMSVSIAHPDAELFIDSKLQNNKITGANISVKLTDEFMTAVEHDLNYVQRFPINADLGDILDNFDFAYNKPELDKLYSGNLPGSYYRVIKARKLWDKIIHNAWKSAEPGVLFIDTIKKESPADYYKEYSTVTTNPCGEVPLCPYDSCRLSSLNLYSFVENPFTDKARFDIALFKSYAYYAQIIMDNVIEIELEHINRIMSKVNSDPESEDIKAVELALWQKIYDKTKQGRRTGIGITGLGDCLAALGFRYDSNEAFVFCEGIFKELSASVYSASIQLAWELGSFIGFDKSEATNNAFVKRIMNLVPMSFRQMYDQKGRRNVASLSIAPAGTISLMTRTTSGIEPVFKVWYTRRRKTSNKDKAVFTDANGEMFEEFKVIHPKFIEWYAVKMSLDYEVANDKLQSMLEKELVELYETSPYYKSTAQDIDWVNKVELQGLIQKYIDHSISCTVNIPKESTIELVSEIYKKAYEVGCKGLTIYRDGSRDGVLVQSTDSQNKNQSLNVPRPDTLKAKIVRFKNSTENWIAFIGLSNDAPYEIFCGKVDDDIRYLPKSITEGWITRVKVAEEDGPNHRYDFKYDIGYGYINCLPGISAVFKSEYWNYARFISGMLRAGVKITRIIDVLDSLNSDMGESINSWKKGVARALRQFVKDGELSSSKCTECGATLVYQGGCKHCPSCGWSRCE